jgi:hypothetical protein
VDDVFANFLCPVSMFISDDFPTFDLPMKANSGKSGFIHSFIPGLLDINFAVFMMYSIISLMLVVEM